LDLPNALISLPVLPVVSSTLQKIIHITHNSRSNLETDKRTNDTKDNLLGGSIYNIGLLRYYDSSADINKYKYVHPLA